MIATKLVEKASLEDLATVVGIEQAAWPDVGEGMIAEEKKFETRLKLGLMNIAYLDEKPAGTISYQLPSFVNSDDLALLHNWHHYNEDLLPWGEVCKTIGLPKNWYDATNGGKIVTPESSTHNPNSNCAFLIGVGVDQSMKGNKLVDELIQYTLKEAKDAGKEYVVGYGRLPQLCELGSATVEQAEQHLLKNKPGTHLPYDYGARFHVKNGAIPICVIPNCMEDSESLDYGFLALYVL